MSNRVFVGDLEVKVSIIDGDIDNSPKNPDNYAVSAHWVIIEDGVISPINHLVWNHNDVPKADGREPLQDALNSCTKAVFHNAKFDASWLIDMEFDLPPVECTMVREFMFAQARPWLLSLKATAERRDVTRKKSDLVDEMFKSGTGFEAMPIDTVLEYAEADVISCAEIYLQQEEELNSPEYEDMKPCFELGQLNLEFLTHMENNGCKIDLDVLDDVEREFIAEQEEIGRYLKATNEKLMGDTPINLNSGICMNKVFYGRMVTDRDLHRRIFNVGIGPNGKPLPPARMPKKTQFNTAVRTTTVLVQKTHIQCCGACDGSGKIQKYKVKYRTKNKVQYRVQGEPYKNLSPCPECKGLGVFYVPTGEKAGLKLVPEGPRDASIHGFKTDKVTLKRLIGQAQAKKNDLAVEYITKFMRYNAISTYLSSFVGAIRKWTRFDGLLHPNFNQTIARTGRLSSSKPNFQNLPKGSKFPVRKCIISRFEGGKISEIDYSGVEFRVAGELSKDSQIIEDILTGKDVHKQTAAIINQCNVSSVTKDMRQAAKSYTFSPLYGGMGMTEPEHIQAYFQAYFGIYKGLATWHKRLMDGVLQDGLVRIPSGKRYMFEDARRLGNGRITNATAVVNYPVQGFAGIIMQLACVRALRAFKQRNLKSKIILTVHDSLVSDVFPGEISQVKEAMVWALSGVQEEIKERFNYDFVLPLDVEMEIGKNWMEMEETELT